METVVDVMLGSEVRPFNVGEFTKFWVTMLEEGRKATTEYLASLDYSPGQENGRTD